MFEKRFHENLSIPTNISFYDINSCISSENKSLRCTQKEHNQVQVLHWPTDQERLVTSVSNWGVKLQVIFIKKVFHGACHQLKINKSSDHSKKKVNQLFIPPMFGMSPRMDPKNPSLPFLECASVNNIP